MGSFNSKAAQHQTHQKSSFPERNNSAKDQDGKGKMPKNRDRPLGDELANGERQRVVEADGLSNRRREKRSPNVQSYSWLVACPVARDELSRMEPVRSPSRARDNRVSQASNGYSTYGYAGRGSEVASKEAKSNHYSACGTVSATRRETATGGLKMERKNSANLVDGTASSDGVPPKFSGGFGVLRTETFPGR